MKRFNVMFKTTNDVKEFVSIVNQCDFDVDLISGKYVVNAKSIMGIFSLDLTKNIILEVDTDEDSDFFEKIKKYIVSWDIFKLFIILFISAFIINEIKAKTYQATLKYTAFCCGLQHCFANWFVLGKTVSIILRYI